MIGSDFKVEVNPHTRKCSECSGRIVKGAQMLVSKRYGKVQKCVCSEECRIAFDDDYWQERVDARERREGGVWSVLVRTVAFFAIVGSAFALDNSVTVYERSGSTQTNRVVSIGRIFAEGEMASGCVTAYAAGSALTTQTDVKTKWADNSLQHAIVSFEIPSLAGNGSAIVEFRNSASCNNTGYKTYTDINNVGGALSWGASMELTANMITHTRNAKTMLTTCGSISTDPAVATCRYWMRGPLVTQIIVEDRTTALSSDFGWRYVASSWVTAPSSTYQSLHPIFVVTFSTPSSGGPFVDVQNIVENTWLSRMQRQDYSIVLKTGSGLATVYTKTTPWKHVIYSRWAVTKPSGTAAGAIFIDHNLAYLIHSNAIPQYDLTTNLAAGTADSLLSIYDTRVGSEEPVFCDPTIGACALIAKIMPATGARHDIGLIHGVTLIALKSMGNPNMTIAKRQEIWDKLMIGNGLAAGGATVHNREDKTDRCYDETCSMNAFGFPVSVDARPTGRTWGNASQGAGDEPICVATTPSDTAADGCGNTNLWQANGSTAKAHTPDAFYSQYMLTGQWFFLTELQFYAANHPYEFSQGFANWQRGDSWGFLNNAENDRWWQHRDLMRAAFLSPDGSPEKTYFTQKFQRNICALEGVYNLPLSSTCPSNASNTTRYWGRVTLADSAPNPMALDIARQNNGNIGYQNTNALLTYTNGQTYYLSYRSVIFGQCAELFPICSGVANAIKKAMIRRALEAPAWQLATYTLPMRPTAMTWFQSPAAIAAAGFTGCALTANVDASTLSFTCQVPDTLNYSDLLPQYACVDAECVLLADIDSTTVSGGFRQTPVTITARGALGTAAASHSTGAQLRLIGGTMPVDVDPLGGYSLLTLAALSFSANDTIEGISGRRAWNMMNAMIPTQSVLVNEPLFAFRPRDVIVAPTASVGTTSATLFWSGTNDKNCGVLVQTAAITSSLDGSDVVVVPRAGIRSYTASGLASGTSYQFRITCGTARYRGSFTTN